MKVGYASYKINVLKPQVCPTIKENTTSEANILHNASPHVPFYYLIWVQGKYLRDKLPNFHLNNGILKLNFKELCISRATIAQLIGIWGENPQHPHVAAHNNLVCKIVNKTEGKQKVLLTIFRQAFIR